MCVCVCVCVRSRWAQRRGGDAAPMDDSEASSERAVKMHERAKIPRDKSAGT